MHDVPRKTEDNVEVKEEVADPAPNPDDFADMPGLEPITAVTAPAPQAAVPQAADPQAAVVPVALPTAVIPAVPQPPQNLSPAPGPSADTAGWNCDPKLVS